MLSTRLRSWQRHTLWLSLLAHVLFLLSLATWIVVQPHDRPQTEPASSIPAYVTSEAPSTPQIETPPAPQAAAPAAEAAPQPELKKIEKNGLEKLVKEKAQVKAAESKPAGKPAPSTKPHKPVFARDGVPEDITNPYDQEPMHLIGESKIIKPLVKIIGRALSRHLFYPRVAADFNLRGVVLVGFVLHPEGYVTETRVVKSSGTGVLDDAASDAVGAMSPIGNVSEYVPAAEFMVIGIIFGQPPRMIHWSDSLAAIIPPASINPPPPLINFDNQ